MVFSYHHNICLDPSQIIDWHLSSSLVNVEELENFDASNVTNIGYLFNNCSSLKSIKGIEKS